MKEKNNLIFLRHSKLSLPYKDHGEMPFSVLSDLGLEKLNPSIDKDYTQKRIEELFEKVTFEKVKRMYVSPSRRTQETGALIKDCIKNEQTQKNKCTVLSYLKEIYFDLEKLDSVFNGQTMMKEKGIHGINSLVFKGMIAGIHTEPVKDAYERAGALFNEIKMLPENGTVILITHDFFMRIIEIYIHRKGVAYYPITLEELEATKRSTYLSGFSTNISLSTFSII